MALRRSVRHCPSRSSQSRTNSATDTRQASRICASCLLGIGGMLCEFRGELLFELLEQRLHGELRP